MGSSPTPRNVPKIELPNPERITPDLLYGFYPKYLYLLFIDGIEI